MNSSIYFKQVELGPMANYVYFVGDPHSREVAVVEVLPRQARPHARSYPWLAVLFGTESSDRWRYSVHRRLWPLRSPR